MEASVVEYLTTLPLNPEIAQLIGTLAPAAFHSSTLANTDPIRSERVIALQKRIRLLAAVDLLKHKRTDKFEAVVGIIIEDWSWLGTALYEVMVHELKRQAILGCLRVPCEEKEALSQMSQIIDRLLPATIGLVSSHVRSDLIRLVHRCQREPFQTVVEPYLLAHSLDQFVGRFVRWAEELHRYIPLALEAVHLHDGQTQRRKGEKRKRKQAAQWQEAGSWPTIPLYMLQQIEYQDAPEATGAAAVQASTRAQRWLAAIEAGCLQTATEQQEASGVSGVSDSGIDWLKQNTNRSEPEVVLALLHTTGNVRAAFSMLQPEAGDVWKQAAVDEELLQENLPSKHTKCFWMQEEDEQLLVPEQLLVAAKKKEIQDCWTQLADNHGEWENTKQRARWLSGAPIS
jgi:hypothetical protein